jgi:aryl-alcohol dehydrogenase-like predicted oxidoreductase
MTYGSTDWQGWLLDEETGLEHIKVAYDAGINAFDTANVSFLIRQCSVTTH